MPQIVYNKHRPLFFKAILYTLIKFKRSEQTWDSRESISSTNITAGWRQLATPKRALTSFSPSPICMYTRLNVKSAVEKITDLHFTNVLVKRKQRCGTNPLACQWTGWNIEESCFCFSSYSFSDHSFTSSLEWSWYRSKKHIQQHSIFNV